MVLLDQALLPSPSSSLPGPLVHSDLLMHAKHSPVSRIFAFDVVSPQASSTELHIFFTCHSLRQSFLAHLIKNNPFHHHFLFFHLFYSTYLYLVYICMCVYTRIYMHTYLVYLLTCLLSFPLKHKFHDGRNPIYLADCYILNT